MSVKTPQTPEEKALLARFNAGIELVKDGMDPYLVLEHVLWPSKAVEQACAGELPHGWQWTPEGERKMQKLERMRELYREKKSS